MNNLRNALDKIIIGICVILFMFMTVVGTYQITSRYVLKDPSTISEELISYSFAWMSMFAASYVFGKRDHMRMVFFVERYSKKIQLNIETKLKEKLEQRQKLYNRIRRCKDTDFKSKLQTETKSYSKEIKELRKQMKLCNGIEKRSKQMEQTISNIQEERGKNRYERY